MAKFSTFAILIVFAACGPATRNGNGDDDGHTDGNTGGADAAACATSVVKADKIPLDLFIMLDQSGSMSDAVNGGGTKWSTVTSALDTFVQQPGLDGVSVGIQYFGVPPTGSATCTVTTCTVDADCGAAACGPCLNLSAMPNGGICLGVFSGLGDSCAATDYATPAVEIAPLPGAATALIASIGMHSPTTGDADVRSAPGRGRSLQDVGAVARRRCGRRGARDRRRSERMRREPRRTSMRSPRPRSRAHRRS